MQGCRTLKSDYWPEAEAQDALQHAIATASIILGPVAIQSRAGLGAVVERRRRASPEGRLLNGGNRALGGRRGREPCHAMLRCPTLTVTPSCPGLPCPAWTRGFSESRLCAAVAAVVVPQCLSRAWEARTGFAGHGPTMWSELQTDGCAAQDEPGSRRSCSHAKTSVTRRRVQRG